MICFGCDCIVPIRMLFLMAEALPLGVYAKTEEAGLPEKKLELWHIQDCLVHHYIATALVTLSIQKF